jgi:penicillin-binding protein 2
MVRWALLLAATVLLAACSRGGGQEGPTPQVIVNPRSPREVAQEFLRRWQAQDYQGMYALVSSEVQAQVPQEQFVQRYQAIAEEATITGIDFELLRPQDGASYPYRVTIHTVFFGDIVQENALPLVEEEAMGEGGPRREWRVRWSPSLIFKELDERTLVHLFVLTPRRGGIYDRNGRPLAVDAEVPVVGIVPGRVRDKDRTATALARALGLPLSQVRPKLDTNVPDYYFVEVQRLPHDTPPERLQPLYALADLGVFVRQEVQRVYPYNDRAAQVLGFLRKINAQELQQLYPYGYREDDWMGGAGLEAAYQQELAGQKGGILATITPQGEIARVIARKEAVPGLDLHLSLDVEVQRAAEEVLGSGPGAVIVMDPRDNAVLALASAPRYNPNDLIRGLSQQEADRLFNSPQRPTVNRALEGAYPPGSTFKVVTMAAGLERGVVTPSTRLPCPPVWTRFPNFPLRNWQSVDRGPLTPGEGLMASCNPVFYEIAYRLDAIDPGLLPDMARAFGFGRPTGIGLPEEAGLVPDPRDPDWKEKAVADPSPWFSGDSVVLGIGQGYLLVTPMQLANAYAAIARGGELERPLLVRKITDAQGNVVREFRPEPLGRLPLSPANLEAIREGLRLVTQSPGGTAYAAFAGTGLDAAGKSGTPEAAGGVGPYHGFFVVYAPRNNPSWLALVFNEGGTQGSVRSTVLARDLLVRLVRTPGLVQAPPGQ